jgi:phytoene desaturase
MYKIGIIGSGFSSLSAACYLAKEGYEVHVFEQHDQVGGRARKLKTEGFTFDMGPSWYWMPGVFETFFQDFGKKVEDYYTLKRLDPSYHVFFKDSEVSIPADLDALKTLFESWEPGSAKQLDAFLKEAAFKYKLGINKIVLKPGKSVWEFFDAQVLLGVFKMHVFQSFEGYIRKFFKDARILKLLEFPILFLGATAKTTPALYSLMNYADIKLGTWYPMGGMHNIAAGMQALATELGVQFHLNAPVDHIHFVNGEVKGLSLKGKGIVELDKVVAGADYHFVETQLVPQSLRTYSDAYWDSRKMAPSSLLFYLGINKKIEKLHHHTLFFDEEFSLHAEEIYTTPKWPSKPLFYLCAPSVTDPSVAPEGCENLFILMPLAPGIEDNEELREKYYHILMARMEKRLGASIAEHVIVKKSYAIKDFTTDYNAYKGNAYGLANTLRQTAILKPSMSNKKTKGLFYTGQLTVPGPGVPPALISGKIVAKEIIKSITL